MQDNDRRRGIVEEGVAERGIRLRRVADEEIDVRRTSDAQRDARLADIDGTWRSAAEFFDRTGEITPLHGHRQQTARRRQEVEHLRSAIEDGILHQNRAVETLDSHHAFAVVIAASSDPLRPDVVAIRISDGAVDDLETCEGRHTAGKSRTVDGIVTEALHRGATNGQTASDVLAVDAIDTASRTDRVRAIVRITDVLDDHVAQRHPAAGRRQSDAVGVADVLDGATGARCRARTGDGERTRASRRQQDRRLVGADAGLIDVDGLEGHAIRADRRGVDVDGRRRQRRARADRIGNRRAAGAIGGVADVDRAAAGGRERGIRSGIERHAAAKFDGAAGIRIEGDTGAIVIHRARNRNRPSGAAGHFDRTAHGVVGHRRCDRDARGTAVDIDRRSSGVADFTRIADCAAIDGNLTGRVADGDAGSGHIVKRHRADGQHRRHAAGIANVVERDTARECAIAIGGDGREGPVECGSAHDHGATIGRRERIAGSGDSQRSAVLR